MLVFLVAWAIVFMIVFPLLWTFTADLYEKRFDGDLSHTFPPKGKCAFVTLVASSDYVRGARVLAYTLNFYNERIYPLVALTVGLEESDLKSLRDVGWSVRQVKPIPFYPKGVSRDVWQWNPQASLGKAHVSALTKMRVWALEEYERIVFVDADMWAVKDLSILCKRQEDIAAMHYLGLDMNSGIMPLKPSKEVFDEMMDFWKNKPDKLFIYKDEQYETKELTNPDQSLIIGYYQWKGKEVAPLHPKYNLNARYSSDENTRVIHFNVYTLKPWHYKRDEVLGIISKLKDEGKSDYDLNIWNYILQWLDLEDRVNNVFGVIKNG